LSAPTISEHLDQLHQSDLIEINPDYADKKWKYYRLTKTARNILERKKANVILVLANISAILTCILLGFYFFLPSILGSVYPTPSANAAYAPSADHETTQIYSATKSLQSTSADYVGLIIVAMVVITLVLFAITYMKRKKL
ncbi:hypothetical protein HY988_01720, partial [Candidatus Micrarchaeota archaeon]|nr:hypothetical protein [Candidatus Micrarchaeota archaeon]